MGLTGFMRTLDHWYRDTDVPDVVKKIMNTLNNCWLDALKHTDETLGIKRGTRDILIKTLRIFGNEVRYMDEDEIMYKFKWNWPME
jgi:hypothetical protein